VRIFRDAKQEYLRSGPFGDESHDEVLQRIRNVKDHKIKRVIAPINDFSEASLATSWSLWMTLCAGTHVWPDANHRTGMVSFNIATQRAFGLFVGLPKATSIDLVRESKEIGRKFVEAKERFYTVAELIDPAHPYRAVYQSYESRLVIVDAPPLGDGRRHRSCDQRCRNADPTSPCSCDCGGANHGADWQAPPPDDFFARMRAFIDGLRTRLS
jgi:hypothetical protein